MALSFHWFLPTYGDSRGLVAGGHGLPMSGNRPATLRYLNQIAAAAESNGFEAVLTPAGLWCEDAWLTTAMLVGTTETLKFLVALRPGLVSPTLAAQMATTFQQQSGDGCCSMSSPAGRHTSSALTATSWTSNSATAAPGSSCTWFANSGLPVNRLPSKASTSTCTRLSWDACPTRRRPCSSAARRKAPGSGGPLRRHLSHLG